MKGALSCCGRYASCSSTGQSNVAPTTVEPLEVATQSMQKYYMYGCYVIYCRLCMFVYLGCKIVQFHVDIRGDLVRDNMEIIHNSDSNTEGVT